MDILHCTYMAAAMGNIAVTRALIHSRARSNVTNWEGKLAIDIAKERHPKLVSKSCCLAVPRHAN